MYCSLFYSSECFDTQQNTRKKNIDVQEFVENNMKKAFPVSIDSRNAFIFLVVFFFLIRSFVCLHCKYIFENVEWLSILQFTSDPAYLYFSSVPFLFHSIVHSLPIVLIERRSKLSRDCYKLFTCLLFQCYCTLV